MFTPLILIAALAVFALLAVWLALEPLAHVPARFRTRRNFDFATALRLPDPFRIAVMPSISGGSPEADVLDDLTDGEKKELKEVGDKADELRSKLVNRLAEIKAGDGEGKEEVERREKELGEQVDVLIGLARKQESDEVKAFKRDLEERLDGFKGQMEKFMARPAGTPKGGAGAGPLVTKEDAYPGDNLFLDMKLARKDTQAAERVREYEEKFAGPDRIKAWASGELEEVDLILPDIQQALPFLRAQAKIVQLFREIRTNSPSIEFPVWKSGLTVGHVKDGEGKPESEPTFDLELARVFTIAGVSDIPNPLLEDFPAARGWVSTELGSATGAQEENDVLTGGGEGEPLGLWTNEEIPDRALSVIAEASLGRKLIDSIFRGAQQVRINGFTEPTDVGLNPAVWTDIALSFEDSIGFLYGPPVSQTAGAPAEQPPARIMGLPVTWSSYVPLDEGGGEDETSVVVGNYQDGIVLRRSPFRIDVDSSPGFKKNLTTFRGEERMGFIVVRPKSFCKVTGIKPSPVE